MNKELRIGVLVVSVVGMLIIGVNYLKGLNIFNKSMFLYVLYDNIDGLQVGAPVLINGYQVGMVGDIDLLVHKKQKLLVKLNIEKQFPIPKNSISRIVNADLMGTKAIILIIGNDTQFVDVGDTLVSSIEGSLQDEVNAQILPLKNKAEELIGSVDSVMTIITTVLNKETRSNLSNSLRSLDRTFKLMSETMQDVDDIMGQNNQRITKIIQNLELISSNIESNNDNINSILTNLSAISDSIVRSNIANTLQNINAISESVNNSDGSLGLLIHNDKIYKNLERSTKELSELIEDIKKHPGRYMNFSILGGGSTPYQK